MGSGAAYSRYFASPYPAFENRGHSGRPSFIAFFHRVQVIGAEADQLSLGVEEFGIEVHEEDMFLIIQLCDDLVDFLALETRGVGGAGPTGLVSSGFTIRARSPRR